MEGLITEEGRGSAQAAFSLDALGELMEQASAAVSGLKAREAADRQALMVGRAAMEACPALRASGEEATRDFLERLKNTAAMSVRFASEVSAGWPGCYGAKGEVRFCPGDEIDPPPGGAATEGAGSAAAAWEGAA